LGIDTAVSSVVRKDQPKNLEVLQNSISRLGSEPVNAICVLGQPKDGKFIIGDGEQRYRVLVGNNTESCVVQVFEDWRTPDDAVAATLQLNCARYNHTEADLLNLLAKTKLSVQTVADYTGLSKSTLERLKSICDKPWLTEAALNGYIGYVPAAELVRACGDDAKLHSALQNSFTTVYQIDSGHVTEWREKFSREHGKKWKSDVRQFATYSFWGRKHDWTYWRTLLDSGAIETVDGKNVIMFPHEPPPQVGLRGIHIEDNDLEWAQRFAVSNLEGARWSEISVEDHARLVDQWDVIGKRVHAAYKRRVEQESAVKQTTTDDQNASAAVEAPGPTPQSAGLVVKKK
jgi:hypothetical protein